MRTQIGARELVELGRAGCGRGEVRRKGYVRKDGVRVKSACVPDKGAPGKTPASRRFLPDLGPRPLNGWKKDMPAAERLSRLRGLARKKGCTDALRTVNAIANVTTDRETEIKLRADYRRLRADESCHLKSEK